MVSICAIDCELQDEVPPVPAQLLRKISSGAYTALRAEGPAFKVCKDAAFHGLFSKYSTCQTERSVT